MSRCHWKEGNWFAGVRTQSSAIRAFTADALAVFLFRLHTEPGKSGKWAVCSKSQGKPEIVREFAIIFIHGKSQGKQII